MTYNTNLSDISEHTLWQSMMEQSDKLRAKFCSSISCRHNDSDWCISLEALLLCDLHIKRNTCLRRQFVELFWQHSNRVSSVCEPGTRKYFTAWKTYCPQHGCNEVLWCSLHRNWNDVLQHMDTSSSLSTTHNLTYLPAMSTQCIVGWWFNLQVQCVL